MLPDEIAGTPVGFQNGGTSTNNNNINNTNCQSFIYPRTRQGFLARVISIGYGKGKIVLKLPLFPNESPVKIGIELVIMQILGFEDFFELCHRFYQDHHDLDNNLLNLCVEFSISKIQPKNKCINKEHSRIK